MDAGLKQHLHEMELRIAERMDALELRMRDHTESVETKLLGEFWKWARTAGARYRQNEGVVIAQ